MALVGHSHLMLGIDKGVLEKELQVKDIAKYTREGVNVIDRYHMTQQLLEENENLSLVIYGVDAWTFTGEGLSANSHQLFYPFMDNSTINKYVKKNDSESDYLTKKLIKSTRYNEQLISGALRGWLGKWNNLKFGKVDLDKLKQELRQGEYRRIKNNTENIEYFEKTLKLLTDNQVKVILVYIPTIDQLENIQQKEFDETIRIFESYTDENIEFINLQDPWSSNYDLFYDPIHLNPSGQKFITEQLSDQIQL